MTKTHHHKTDGHKASDHKKDHRQDDHKEKTVFACSKCKDKFDSLADLKKHQEKHPDSLEKLKEEIIHGVEHEIEEHDKKRLSWGGSLVSIVLVILTIVSIISTAQSASIYKKVNSGDFKSSVSSSKSGGSALPASLDSLPQMVGGC